MGVLEALKRMFRGGGPAVHEGADRRAALRLALHARRAKLAGLEAKCDALEAHVAAHPEEGPAVRATLAKVRSKIALCREDLVLIERKVALSEGASS